MLDRLESAVDELAALRFDALTTPERLLVLERLERVARRLPVAGHALINGVRQQATPVELAESCRTRWPTGCASPAARPPAASAKPRTSANGRL
ncbi:putative rEP13E12 repeat protein [Mycobacterium xenopi 4042]|uniref:Putative rEP13E12 repeat protein n=1 Tax=Mycobacterium xenopi 4042 TaxID=1299334 RepID=X8DAV4_MYCXE|nr:putative rEP13E12 repeat protein [Mycobacterium xenopi 4042]